MRTASGGGGRGKSKRQLAAPGRYYQSLGRQIQTEAHRQRATAQRRRRAQIPAATIPVVGQIVRAPIRASGGRTSRSLLTYERAHRGETRAQAQQRRIAERQAHREAALRSSLAAERAYRSLGRQIQTQADRDAAAALRRRSLASERYYSTFTPRGKVLGAELGLTGADANRYLSPSEAARRLSAGPGRGPAGQYQADRRALADVVATSGVGAAREYLARRKLTRMAPALDALEQISRPVYASAGAARAAIRGENVLRGAARGAELKDKYLYSDVLNELGWRPKSGVGKALRGTSGFLLDVGLDPTTYVTFGGSSVAREAGVKVARQAGEAAVRAQLRVLAPEIAAGRITRAEARAQAKSAGRQVARRKLDQHMARASARDKAPGLRVSFGPTKAARGGARALQRRQTLARAVRQAQRGEVPTVRRVRRAGRRAPAAPLVRTTAALNRSQRAAYARLFGERGSQLGQAVRNVAADVHAGVRPAGLTGAEHTQVKAIRREARAEAERLARRSAARSNALLRRLSARDGRIVRHAIELDDLSLLKDDRLREIAVQIRSENRYRRRLEERAGILATQVGRRSRTRGEVRAQTQAERRVAEARGIAVGGRGLRPHERMGRRGLAETRELLAEARRIGAPTEVLEAEADRLTAQIARAEGAIVQRAREGRRGVRALRGQRLAGQALGYFPRITKEEVERQGLLKALAGGPRVKLPERLAAKRPRPSSSEAREYRQTVEALRAGTPTERSYAAKLSDDLRAAVHARGEKGATGVQQATLNRKLVQTFGRTLRGLPSVNTLDALKAKGYGVYRLRRGDLEPMGADDMRELAKAARGQKQKGLPDLSDVAAHGQYVVLPDRVVARAYEHEGIGQITPAGRVFDKLNRTFKSAALMTPAYLVRNLAGDFFNAFTREQAWRLMVNAGRGQRVLHALGKQERALGRRNLGKGQQALRELGTLRAAGGRLHRTLAPGLRQIKLTPEQAREIAGPSSDRLYNAIRRAHPDLSKAEIQAQIERNLSTGKVPALHLALVAEQAGVIRQGRFLELMQEGRNPLKGRAGSPWTAASKRVEDSMRIATFLGGLKRGHSVREAADRANAIHFDYGDLTPIEKKAFRRVMPFYTFPSRNLPYQAKTFAQRPGKYATVEKAREEGRRQADLPEGYEANLSEFERRQLPIPIRLPLALGGQRVTVSIGSPFTDLNDIFGAAAGPVSAAAGGSGKGYLAPGDVAVKRFLEMLGPAKVAAEVPLNKSFFFREDIAPEGRRLTRAPQWAIQAARTPGLGRQFREATGMQQAKGGPVMWDKRAEYVFRSAAPGIIGATGEAASLIPGFELGVKGKTGRGRTLTQRRIGLFGPRVTSYDAKAGISNRLYDQRGRIDARLGDLRQLAKEAGRSWETPHYKRLLARRRRVQARIDQLNPDQATTTSTTIAKGRPPRTAARTAAPSRRLLVPPPGVR